MTDLLVRDVPDHVVAAIDAKAKRLGLSRTEYLRRQITRAATGATGAVRPTTFESSPRASLIWMTPT